MMQLVPSAGKHVAGAKTSESTQSVSISEKLVWQCLPVTSAGKHVTGVKRGKTCDLCQARGNV